MKVEPTVFTVSVVISFHFSQQTHSFSEKKGNMVSSGHTVGGGGERGSKPRFSGCQCPHPFQMAIWDLGSS